MKKNTILILLAVLALQGCLKKYVSEAPAIPATKEKLEASFQKMVTDPVQFAGLAGSKKEDS